jgi:hypothetical protein
MHCGFDEDEDEVLLLPGVKQIPVRQALPVFAPSMGGSNMVTSVPELVPHPQHPAGEEDLVVSGPSLSEFLDNARQRRQAVISSRKSSKRPMIQSPQKGLLAHLARSSPRLHGYGFAAEHKGLRSYKPAEVQGPICHKKGSKRPLLQTQEECDAFKIDKAVRDAHQLISEPMAAKVITFLAAEVEAIGPTVYGERLVAHLRTHAGTGAQMTAAVLALLSLAKFVKENFSLEPANFEFSSGMISIYLGAMTAVTMPRARLAGLRFAQNVFGAFCDANNPVLSPFLVKVSKGGHAPATPLSCVLHLSYLAHHSTTFIKVYAASFLCMVLTSLRYCDAMRSGVPKRTGQAFDGKARRGKMSSQPMLWYCPLKDFTGSAIWSATWLSQLQLLGRDHLFPNFVGECIGDTREWSFDSTPPLKSKVYGALIYMLMLPPLSLTGTQAKAAVKLHGMRRVVPILARLFSSILHLTIEDRNELGRWAYTSSGAMPNLYSDEAYRPRQIEVREKVLAHSRSIFTKWKGDYANISMDNSYSMCYGSGKMAFEDIEPGLDEEELEDENPDSDDSDGEGDSLPPKKIVIPGPSSQAEPSVKRASRKKSAGNTSA